MAMRTEATKGSMGEGGGGKRVHDIRGQNSQNVSVSITANRYLGEENSKLGNSVLALFTFCLHFHFHPFWA